MGRKKEERIMKTAQKLLGLAALTFACSMLGTGCSAGDVPASGVSPAAAAQETLSVDLDDGVAHVTKLRTSTRARSRCLSNSRRRWRKARAWPLSWSTRSKEE